MLRILTLLLALTCAASAQVPMTGAGLRTPAVAPTYTGPGNIVSGAVAWYGLRAYNAAYATGSNPAADICDAATGLTCTTINILSNGNFDTATASTFCTAHTSCTVSKLYDQTGHAYHVTQSNNSNRPTLVFSALSSFPTIKFGATGALVSGAVSSVSQPISAAYVVGPVTVTNHDSVITSSGGNFGTGIKSTTASIFEYSGNGFHDDSGGTTVSWETGQVIWTSGTNASNLYFDYLGGTSLAFTSGSNGIATSITIGGATIQTQFQSNFMEAGFWPSAFSSGNQTSMYTNMHTYWGF